ncbi:MAG: hypothetical protein IH583_16765 [Candidatus Aminicenantes bacterium]|nr:hypothetical protein [Candidatus Aminicenantes bacterium]
MNPKKMGTFLLFACFALMSCGNAPTGAGGGDTASSETGAEPVFGYPVAGEPWYFVKCGFILSPVPAGLAGSTWSVGRVTIDGARARDFVVYQGGREVDQNGLTDAEGRLAFDIKVRFSWRPNSKSEMRLELVEAKSGKKEYIVAALQSPAGEGTWDPAWNNYLSLVLSEEHGFARTGYPVHATVGILANYMRSPDEIRVVRAERKGADIVYEEIPSQVYDVATWNDPKILAIEEKDANTGERVLRYHPTTSFSVAFLADLKAGEKATYLVFYNNPKAMKPVYETDLSVKKGKDLGRTIENAFYKIVLQEKSGVIYEIVEKTTGTQLEHKLETNGAIHWNPDVYAPPHAWYHSSDWSGPEATEVAGPVFYSLNLKGRLPFPEGIDIGLRYHFYAGSPVVMVESVTDIKDDLFVMALRNAEVVFNAEVFTKAAFKRDGRTEILDFAASKMHPAHAAVLRPDTPWVSLFDEAKGIGFATLYLDLATPNLNGGQASLQQPYIYIQHGLWFYVSRGFVYSFGSNNQTRMLPVKAGSVYYDRNAWIAFPYPREDGLGDYLDRQFNGLKYPVAMHEDIETFAESPEGWVVPILTEPFEEGVKDAKGGKERRK